MEEFMDYEEQLRKLTGIFAPSGFEELMIKYMVEKMKSYKIETEVDPLGNVMVQLGNPSGKPKVMILAHMDEVGLIVRKIEPDGFLRVDKIGGISESTLLGSRVVIRTEKGDFINGLVGSRSHHLVPIEERGKQPSFDRLYVDIGCKTREEVLSLGIAVGSPITYAKHFFRNGSIVFSPVIDNRGGCLALIKLIEILKDKKFNPSIYMVTTVEEEYNLRGVLPVARKINPDFAIDLDVAVSCDTPDLDKTDLKLGSGPVVNMYSFHGRGTLAGVIPNPKLKKLIIDTSLKAGISIQRNVFYGGLTDASFLRLENNGIPSIEVGFPTRYTHSPFECADLKDIGELIELLKIFIIGLPVSMDLSRY